MCTHSVICWNPCCKFCEAALFLIWMQVQGNHLISTRKRRCFVGGNLSAWTIKYQDKQHQAIVPEYRLKELQASL